MHIHPFSTLLSPPPCLDISSLSRRRRRNAGRHTAGGPAAERNREGNATAGGLARIEKPFPGPHLGRARPGVHGRPGVQSSSGIGVRGRGDGSRYGPGTDAADDGERERGGRGASS